MNLIPLALTVVATILGSIFVDFEVGLLSGFIVGLVALQREIHLKIVALQDQVRLLSNPLSRAPEKDSITKSKFDEPDPESDEPRSHSSQAVSIAAKPAKLLVFEPSQQPDEGDEIHHRSKSHFDNSGS